jgi:hypothetical protein
MSALSATSRGARASAWGAIAVLVGWHVVALTIVGAGLYLTVHAFASHPDKAGILDLVPGVIALLALVTLRPHGNSFASSGTRLLRGEQKELFTLLDSATTAVDLPEFDEVYVDTSATVTAVQRNGVFGIGGRYALVLGSALLQSLSPAELRALVAHEAARLRGDGTFTAGIERTRVRMRRGLAELPRKGGALPNLPFGLCALFFLRSTAALSRSHTIAVDDMVAGAIGARPLAAALNAADLLPAALAAYRDSSAPSDGHSFWEFTVSEEGSRAMEFARFRDADASAGEANMPVRERVARLAATTEDTFSSPGQTAARLIADFPTLERRLTRDELARR